MIVLMFDNDFEDDFNDDDLLMVMNSYMQSDYDQNTLYSVTIILMMTAYMKNEDENYDDLLNDHMH